MRPENYEKNYNSALDTLKYIIEHPYRASFQKMLPRFIHRHLYGSTNPTILNLTTLLSLMGLHNELPKLEKVLLGVEEGDPKDQLALLLEHLYNLFEGLSAHPSITEYHEKIKGLKKEVESAELHKRIVFLKEKKENGLSVKNIPDIDAEISRLEGQFNDNSFSPETVPLKNLIEKKAEISSLEKKIEDHNVSLKKLKNVIHQFARENDFPCRILNLDYLTKNSEEEKRPFDKQRLAFIKNLRENFGSSRKYAYIQDERFDADAASAEKERAKKRKVESRLNVVSLSISLIVGMGEGLVAGVFAAVTMPMWIALLAIGLPGAIINYFLFRGDSFSILKDIYFGRIWKKPNGDKLSRTEKTFVGISLIFSLGAGASFGFLAFGSALTGFAPIFAFIGLTANPVGLLVLAGLIAIVTAAALFTIFAYLTVNWVRNGGPLKLLNKILSIKKDFITFCKHERWSELSAGQKCLHVMKKAFMATYKFVFFIIALAAVIVGNVATIGLFKRHAALIFKSVFHLDKFLSKVFSFLITVAMGGIVTAIFYGNSVLSVLKTFKAIGTKIVSAIGSGILFSARHPVRSLRIIGNGCWRATKGCAKALWKASKKTVSITWKSIKTAYSACRHPMVTYKKYKAKKQPLWQDRKNSLENRNIDESCNTNYIKRFYTAKSFTTRAALLPMVAANGFGQGYGAGTDVGAQQWTRAVIRLNPFDTSIAIASTKIPGSAGANAEAVFKATAVQKPLNEEITTGTQNAPEVLATETTRNPDNTASGNPFSLFGDTSERVPFQTEEEPPREDYSASAS